ncbi:MAG: hypothetical protein J4G05_09180 [Chlorobi bacterium]|nr:hypothetical protein [Chlorobiota bacterium]
MKSVVRKSGSPSTLWALNEESMVSKQVEQGISSQVAIEFLKPRFEQLIQQKGVMVLKVSDIPAGPYLLQIKTSEGVFTEKVVIE